jgi:hypothetical protein
MSDPGGDDRLLSHTLQMLPGAELMKAANRSNTKGNSFFEKMLASRWKVLK